MRPNFQISLCFNCCHVFDSPEDDAPVKCPRCSFSTRRVLYEEVMYWVRYPTLCASIKKYDEECEKDPSLPQAIAPEVSFWEGFLLNAIVSGVTYELVRFFGCKILFSVIHLFETKSPKDRASLIHDDLVVDFLNKLSNEETLQDLRAEADNFFAAFKPDERTLGEALDDLIHDEREYLDREPLDEFAPLVPKFLSEQFQAVIDEYSQSEVPTTPVFILRNGKRYHLAGCQFIERATRLETNKRSAELAGFRSCKICAID